MLPKVAEPAGNGFLGQVFWEQLRLLYYCADRPFLLVRRVPMAVQRSQHHPPQIGAGTLAQSPVNADVVADGLNKFPRDHLQLIVAQHLHGAAVGRQSALKANSPSDKPSRSPACSLRSFELHGLGFAV